MDINAFFGQTFKLTDLLDYHEGSVVSRNIIDKPTGTITLFAFDKDERLSEHTAPFDAFVYILDGEAEVIISREPIQVKQGEMIIMPANKSHALKAIR